MWWDYYSFHFLYHSSYLVNKIGATYIQDSTTAATQIPHIAFFFFFIILNLIINTSCIDGL